MKAIINTILKAVMLVALPVGISVPCGSKKKEGSAANEKAKSEASATNPIGTMHGKSNFYFI